MNAIGRVLALGRFAVVGCQKKKKVNVYLSKLINSHSGKQQKHKIK